MKEPLPQSILDSLGDPIAVLDADGVIAHVNAAWRQFAWRNGCSRAQTSPIGTNYLRICEAAAGTPAGEEAAQAAAGIRAVMSGRREEFQLEYPCHSPHEQRWFRMVVTRLHGSTAAVVVCHRNVTVAKRTEIASRLAQTMLRQMSEEDLLTGLPNRMLLMQRLDLFAERNRIDPSFCFALLFVHLDAFKLINDAIGHEAGDEILMMMGQRLRDAATPDAFAARFGDDRFVYVASGIAGVEEASRIAARVRGVLANPYRIQGQELRSSVTIGIAMGDLDACDPYELLRNGSIALSEAQQAGPGCIILFDATMHDRLSRRLRLEAALRQALERRELTVLYQPIVDLEDGRVLSAEALPQWHHADLGIVSPHEFMPLAEQTGLSAPLGEWLLREACAQWSRWQRQGGAAAPPQVSVNLSRVQLAPCTPLLEGVRAALELARMPATALQLEIAERDVIKEAAGTREALFNLHELGVQLALDEFGTAPCTLTCLSDYPFSSVKLDRGFVASLGGDAPGIAVAQAIVRGMDDLGFLSIADGVENSHMLERLRAIGCRAGQGGLFARPLPGDVLVQTHTSPT